MNTSFEYELLSWAGSLFATILAIAYLTRVITVHRGGYPHACNLGKAVGLVVIAIGLLISASGLLLDESALAIAGLSIARGALLALLLTLLLAANGPQRIKC